MDQAVGGIPVCDLLTLVYIPHFLIQLVKSVMKLGKLTIILCRSDTLVAVEKTELGMKKHTAATCLSYTCLIGTCVEKVGVIHKISTCAIFKQDVADEPTNLSSVLLLNEVTQTWDSWVWNKRRGALQMFTYSSVIKKSLADSAVGMTSNRVQ